MDIGNRLKEHRTSLAVVGLGYVGLPLAVAFARHFSVIGFDANEEKSLRIGKAMMSPRKSVMRPCRKQR